MVSSSSLEEVVEKKRAADKEMRCGAVSSLLVHRAALLPPLSATAATVRIPRLIPEYRDASTARRLMAKRMRLLEQRDDAMVEIIWRSIDKKVREDERKLLPTKPRAKMQGRAKTTHFLSQLSSVSEDLGARETVSLGSLPAYCTKIRC